jgi:predicted dehydrogenase
MSGVRAVVIGAGANVARSHLRALEAIGADVVGLYDVHRERLEAVAETSGHRAFTDLGDLLKQPVDLAIVVAPHPFHADLALDCLEAGLHVLVEKPIADQVAQADRMRTEAERRGRILAVALQHRARPDVQAARRLIRSGAIGEIQRADLLATWPRRATYFQVAPWRGTWRGEGGGILLNQGQHDLDVLFHLVGVPHRVMGWTRTRVHAIETEDTAVALVEWDSGAIGSIHLSTCEADQSQRIELTGTAGRLRLSMGRLEVVRNSVDFRDFVASPGDAFGQPETGIWETVEDVAQPLLDGHTAVYRNLVQALSGKSALLAPASEAITALEVANAIALSSATSAEVTLPLDRGAYAAFLAARRVS